MFKNLDEAGLEPATAKPAMSAITQKNLPQFISS